MRSPRPEEVNETVSAEVPLAAGSEATLSEEGPIVAGRYRLLALLGAGGMGSVYRVRDLELDEIVALKMIRRESVSAPGVLARFRQEVKLARRVTHKNVARTFDIGEHANERFLTMEYIDGASLAGLIANARPQTREALQIVRSVAEGLAAAHEAGVIHLDLKPDNVMVESSGRVVITDFGIARLGGGVSSGAEWVGTPAYMAPEQVEGRGDLDARCDLYALGEVLFELLTGQEVWTGPNAIACASVRLLKDPPNPCTVRPDLPARVGDLTVRLLARRREERIATAAEVIAAIDAIDVRERWSVVPRAPSVEAPRSQRAREISIAVLPFRNDGATDDYLSEGVADDLLDTLSITPSLRVRPRSMLDRLEGKLADPRAVGRELAVDVVVEGSLRRRGPDAFRLAIRVVSVADGFQLWAQRFDLGTADLFVVSDTAARSIAEALAAHVVLPVRDGASDPVAIDLYLRAREELRRRGYSEGVDDAIPHLEEALRREPNEPHFLAAYAIARSRINQSASSLALAVESAERATTIAPHLAEGWVALASVRLMTADYERSIHAAARALDCSPHVAEAHRVLGEVMYQVGWTQAAIKRNTLALTLDPSLNGPAITLAVTHALLGEYERAEAMLLDASLRDGPVHHVSRVTAWRIALWRRLDRAREELRVESNTAARIGRFFHARAFGTGAPTEGDQIGPDASYASRTIASFMGQFEAETAAFAGDTERALRAIAFADENGLVDITWMDRLPLFAELRAMPRFQELRARVEGRAALLRAVLVEAGFEENPGSR